MDDPIRAALLIATISRNQEVPPLHEHFHLGPLCMGGSFFILIRNHPGTSKERPSPEPKAPLLNLYVIGPSP